MPTPTSGSHASPNRPAAWSRRRAGGRRGSLLAAAVVLGVVAGPGAVLAMSSPTSSIASRAAGFTPKTAAGATAADGTAPTTTASASTAAPAGSGPLVIASDILPGLSALTPAPAPQNQTLDIGVALSQPDSSGESTYEQALYDPSSPLYHHFLTPTQFAARFSVPASTYRAVTGWLSSGGLHVTFTDTARSWVLASGTVAQVSKLMDTTIASYTSKGVSFLANESGPTIPGGDSILDVVGLNTLQRMSVPQQPSSGSPASLPAQTPAVPGCLPECDYTPQDMWSMYDMPSSDEGQGQTMAVLGEGQTADVVSNLRAFEASNKLPQIPVTVDNVGSGPFTDDSGQVEWDLDTQSSTGMAPEVTGETLYFGASLADADAASIIADWVNDPNGPSQANASWGECETDPANPVFNLPPFDEDTNTSPVVGLGDDLEPAVEPTLEQATMEGRTLFAAAGDTGSSCPLLILPEVGAGNGVVNQGVPFQNYPCASDYTVCVGGTLLYSDGNSPPSRALEFAWPFTGGGSSAFIKEPSFQQGVAAIDHPCVVDDSGSPYPGGTICRGAPDVAAMSGDGITDAYDIYANGSATVEAGTSLASPLWMGMWTRVQAAAPAKTVDDVTSYPGLGYADPTIYAVGTGKEGNYARDFFDVTLGTNGYYHATEGWDYVSGWGVPDVTNLVQDLDGTLTPANDVGPPTVGAPTLPCGVLWENSAHTATDTVGNSDPQLSLLTGSMHLSSDGDTLVVDLSVDNLSESVPTGATAEDWYMTWSFGGKTYFAQAQLGALPGSAPTFDDGTVVTTGTDHTFEAANTDTGKFTLGANGVVEIDVPLANIGAPATGAVLGDPAGVTYTEEGVPPNPAGLGAGSLQPVDSGGPTNNYTVGATCPE